MPSSNALLKVDRQLLGEIYTSDEAWKNLLYLCEECGSRFIGTDEEVKARNFMRRKFKAFGFENVRLESFSYLCWSRSTKGPSLKVIAPDEFEIQNTISLPYCPATSTRGVVADVIDVGDGVPNDFKRVEKKISGRIVIATNTTPAYFRERWVHRAEKYGRAVAAGAVGFIYVNMSGGLLPETGCLRFNREAEIPGVSISKEDYFKLTRLASKRKLKMQLMTCDSVQPAKAYNVVGDLPGSRKSEEMVIVGAHYDGHDVSPGAGDNANGAAVLLETARVLSTVRKHLRRTVRFVSFCCEEIGLVGAFEYVKKHKTELDRARFMLNIDGIPAGEAKGLLFHGWEEMKPYVARLSKEMNYRIPFGSRLSAYSDFFPYFLAGVPTATIANPNIPSRGRGVGHTAADTPDKIDPRDLREAVDVISRIILRVANDDKWPLRRRAQTEVERLLVETGLDEILEAQGKKP